MEKKFIELAKPRITPTRKLIISKISATGGFKLAELGEFREGNKTRTMILRGGIEVSSLKNLRNIRDAINTILDDEGYYETETGTLNSKGDLLYPDEAMKIVERFKASNNNKKSMPYLKDTGNIGEQLANHKANVVLKDESTGQTVEFEKAPTPQEVVESFEQSMQEVESVDNRIEDIWDDESWGDEDESEEVPMVEGEEEAEPLPEGYEEYKVSELYALCVSRSLKASAKKSRSYYINILEKSVDKQK